VRVAARYAHVRHSKAADRGARGERIGETEQRRAGAGASSRGMRASVMVWPKHFAFPGRNAIVLGMTSGPAIRRLENQVPVHGLAGAKTSKTYFRITLPENRHYMDIRIFGGSGDADLYVRRDALPTMGTYDSRPAKIGNDEVVAAYHPGAPAASQRLLNDPLQTVRLPRVVKSSGKWSFHVRPIPPSRIPDIGRRDVLLVSDGASSSGAAAPTSLDYYIMLYGYHAYSGVSLEASYR
jgi:hypothetical protein